MARLGGDEFAILIHAPHGIGPDGEVLRQRFSAALEEPFRIDDLELKIGGSIGRAVFPLDGEDAEALLRTADAAMFEAKRERHASMPNGGRRA